MIDNRGAHIGGARTANPVRTCMFGFPHAVKRLGLIVIVRAVKEDEFAFVTVFGKMVRQIVLGTAGFGKDERLLRRAKFGCFVKTGTQCAQQRLSLGVLGDRNCEIAEGAKLNDFLFDGNDVFLREKLGRFFIVDPFFGGFIETVIVGGNLLFDFFVEILPQQIIILDLALQLAGERIQGAGNRKCGRRQ